MNDSRFLRSRALAAVTAALAIACSVIAVAAFEQDRVRRERARQFFTEYAHGTRRPLIVETVDLAPRGDWLAGIIADAVLDDVYGEVNLSDATPEARQAWIELLPRIDSELLASREFLLESLRARSGWAMHLASLGQIEYSLQTRQMRHLKPERWRRPLRSAAAAAPGSDVIPVFHAAGEIELALAGRVRLGESEKNTINRSFRDASFLQAALPAVNALFGVDESLRIVPDEPRPLRSTFEHLAAGDDVRRAAAVWKRFERAEWEARERELQEAERVAALGDRARLSRLVRQWASSHSPTDFGTKGASQLVRLLKIWPAADPGFWRGEPRSAIVMSLLAAHGEVGAAGKAIWRAVQPLEGMPEPVRARTMLAGGLVDEAQRFALRSDSSGTLDWTDFWIAAAREGLRRGDRERSSFALDQISPAARDACDVLLLRLDLGPRADRKRVQTLIERARDHSQLRPTRRGEIPLCLEDDDRLLVASVSVTEPALVEIVWDGIRYETIVVVMSGEARIPVGTRRGRSIFALRPLDGARPEFNVALR